MKIKIIGVVFWGFCFLGLSSEIIELDKKFVNAIIQVESCGNCKAVGGQMVGKIKILKNIGKK